MTDYTRSFLRHFIRNAVILAYLCSFVAATYVVATYAFELFGPIVWFAVGFIVSVLLISVITYFIEEV